MAAGAFHHLVWYEPSGVTILDRAIFVGAKESKNHYASTLSTTKLIYSLFSLLKRVTQNGSNCPTQFKLADNKKLETTQ